MVGCNDCASLIISIISMSISHVIDIKSEQPLFYYFRISSSEEEAYFPAPAKRSKTESWDPPQNFPNSKSAMSVFRKYIGFVHYVITNNCHR